MNKNTDKLGRNAPCPCGSGKKYKKCCRTKNTSNNRYVKDIPHAVYDEIIKKTHDNIAKERLREQNYGKVRPIIHNDFKGYKLVAVGSELHWSRTWKNISRFFARLCKEGFGY